MSGAGSAFFDGADDKVVNAHTADSLLSGAFYFDLLLYQRSKQAVDFKVVIAKADGGAWAAGCALYYTAAGRLRFWAKAYETKYVEIPDLSPGWHHLAVGHDMANVVAWANRTKYTGAALVTACGDTGFNPTIGHSAGANYGRFSAWNARLYVGVAPTQAAVDAHSRGIYSDNAGLRRWWKLESIAGGTTREGIMGTDDAVTGSIITSTCPFVLRTVSPARGVA